MPPRVVGFKCLCFFQAMELSKVDLKLKDKEQVRLQNQLVLCSREIGQHSFKLPPSSPYDKFLKAAGC